MQILSGEARKIRNEAGRNNGISLTAFAANRWDGHDQPVPVSDKRSGSVVEPGTKEADLGASQPPLVWGDISFSYQHPTRERQGDSIFQTLIVSRPLK